VPSLATPHDAAAASPPAPPARALPAALRTLLAAGLVAGALAACRGEAPPPAAPPPAEVAVVTVAPRSIADAVELVGEVRASRAVQVRAQVTGVITERPFREGSQVRAGEVLYRIEPENYDADYRVARAQLAEAEARLSNATTNVGRLRPLLADNAVARQDVDNAETAVASARAGRDAARAAVDRARQSLSETVVRAEIAGRVGRALLDVGTRVTGSGDVLTTIDVLDPVYVSFRPAAQQQLQWRRDPAAREALAPGGSARVDAVLADGSVFPTPGRIAFVDPVVDPQTGTQEYRAHYPNPDRLLLPGQFVRVRLQGLVREGAILVPQRAVLQQLGRQTVYVVGADGKVAAREVKATGWSGGSWLIEEGLAAGDRVVVDGVQKVRPGAAVRAVALVDSAAGPGDAPERQAAPTAAPAAATAAAPAPAPGAAGAAR
jgi:membrane fusion protein (multidrug efflux system)